MNETGSEPTLTAKNRLYLNRGNFKFKDITDQAGVGSESGFETAVTAADVNADGWLDILMAGNKYGFEVETHPCDAGNGTLLLGDGKGNFAWLDNIFSGFWASREAHDLAMLRGAGGKRIFVVANTNSALQIFE